MYVCIYQDGITVLDKKKNVEANSTVSLYYTMKKKNFSPFWEAMVK